LSLAYYAWIMRKMYMEESPDMSRAKEPKSMVAVMIFGAVIMVGFGIWHAPILEFASEALPNLSETMAQISTNSTGLANGDAGGGSEGQLFVPSILSTFMLEQMD
jgi:F420H2 dehydrogenase subunit N